MDEKLGIQAPMKKIYKDKAIWVGTFLGGPLVAGYLMAENFKAFNRSDKAKKTWVYTVISTIMIFGSLFLIPEQVKIPNFIIPLIYTVIAYSLVQYFQGQSISAHLRAGGQFYSWWRIIAVGIIGIALTSIPIFGFALLSNSIENASIATKTYGVMKHEISFNKNNISENEVNTIADGLTKTTFFDEMVTKYVYVEKVNDTYELSLSVIKGIAYDNQDIQPFIDLRTDLQTLFPQNKIVFKLVEDNLDNVVKTIK